MGLRDLNTGEVELALLALCEGNERWRCLLVETNRHGSLDLQICGKILERIQRGMMVAVVVREALSGEISFNAATGGEGHFYVWLASLEFNMSMTVDYFTCRPMQTPPVYNDHNELKDQLDSAILFPNPRVMERRCSFANEEWSRPPRCGLNALSVVKIAILLDQVFYVFS